MRGIPDPDTISVHVAVCPVQVNADLIRFNNADTPLVAIGGVVDDIPAINIEVYNSSAVRVTACIIVLSYDV